MEDILSRSGVNLNRSTLYDWMAAVADVTKPLYELMKNQVMQSRIIQTDDTSVKLIDATAEGGSRTARFWAYRGDNDHLFEVYDFTESRERAGPQAFLQGYTGYLQADAYGGYDGIYLDSGGRIIEVACWAHCRRYWHKARDEDPSRAHHALAVIASLYKLESETSYAPGQLHANRLSSVGVRVCGVRRWSSGAPGASAATCAAAVIPETLHGVSE